MELEEMENTIKDLIDKQNQLASALQEKDAKIAELEDKRKELMEKVLTRIEPGLPEKKREYTYDDLIEDAANILREKYKIGEKQ